MEVFPGIAMDPAVRFGTVTGTFWWDINEFQAAHPGMFVGQPLNIIVAEVSPVPARDARTTRRSRRRS